MKTLLCFVLATQFLTTIVEGQQMLSADSEVRLDYLT